MRYFAELMETMEVTQAKLARKLSLNQGRLSALISGKRKPTDKEAKMLEQFFELPANILFQEVKGHEDKAA